MQMNNKKRPGPKNAGATVKRLAAYAAKPYKLKLIVVAVCILVSGIVSVVGALFIKSLIDDYVTPMLASATPDFGPLLRAILTMVCIYLVGIVATYAYNYLMVGVSQGVLKQLRDDMFEHMQKLPIRYFDTNQFGDIMSRYTNDSDALRNMISRGLPQMATSAVTVLMVFTAMVVSSPILTLVVLATITVMLQFTKNIGAKSGMYFHKQQKDIGAVNGYIEELIGGQKVVKVFNHEKESKEGFDALNQQLCDSATSANAYANIMMPVMGNFGYIQYILVAIVGGALAVSGVSSLTLGAIASFLQLSRSFNMPLSQIFQQYNVVIMAIAGAERIFELMDEEQEQDEGHVTLVNVKQQADGSLVETEEHTGLWAWKDSAKEGGPTYTLLQGDIRFKDVNFRYVEDKPVLKEVSLFAKPGQKIALVGATGAGKTTITNLINRFYDIQSGEILYDGINIRDIHKPDLRRSLGIVLQDTHLFTGTIRENIRYGNPKATDEEVVAAAKLANAHGFISRLPNGYDTVIEGDGAGLSQGQKQLLSIARAAVADPPVMILDEATSSIDTRTETIVQRGMDALMEGRTVFVIAHRLSTIQNAHAILVMDNGQIVERGDHQQLLEQKGIYYRLYTGATEIA